MKRKRIAELEEKVEDLAHRLAEIESRPPEPVRYGPVVRPTITVPGIGIYPDTRLWGPSPPWPWETTVFCSSNDLRFPAECSVSA